MPLGRRTLSALAAVFALATLNAAAQLVPSPGGDPAHLARIATATPANLEATLAGLGYDVECLEHGVGFLDVVASPAEMTALTAMGFAPIVLSNAEGYRAIRDREDIPVGYHDLAAINASLAQTAAAHPTLATVVDLSTTFGPGPTVGNRSIMAIKISDNATTDEDEPNVLFAACHHSREIVTPEIALDIIDRLVTGYGVDPRITAVVDNQEIWIIPCQNPDGLDYTWTTNNLWRKNRRPNGDGTFGVDLNRNYPLGWSGGCPGTTQTSSETYRGPAPASEIETQTMMAFARARRFARVMDYHSSGREVLLSYLCSPMPGAIENFIDAEGTSLSALSNYGTRNPSAEGEHQMFQIKEITEYAYLTETATTFQPPYADAVSEAARVWPAALAFLERPIPLEGHVRDALTQAPVVAEIAVQGILWTQGETRFSHPAYGRYHLFLSPGTYQISFSAPGYGSQVETVTLGAGTTLRDVALTPLAATFALEFASTGNGAGDLHIGLRNIPPQTSEGFTLFSFATQAPLGSGIVFGLTPDLFLLQILGVPRTEGHLFHWAWPAAPGLYPSADFDLPLGTLPFPPGLQADGLGIALSPASSITGVTVPVRATF